GCAEAVGGVPVGVPYTEAGVEVAGHLQAFPPPETVRGKYGGYHGVPLVDGGEIIIYLMIGIDGEGDVPGEVNAEIAGDVGPLPDIPGEIVIDGGRSRQ